MGRFGDRFRRRRGQFPLGVRPNASLTRSSLNVEPLEVRALLAINTLYAVNAGGPEVIASDSTVWEADTPETPSPYSNQSTALSAVFGNGKIVNTTAVPAEVPASIFNTERYDAGGTPMEWDFPVAAGNYEVRLYFAEIYNGAHSVGSRVFDVSIEGITVLDDYDTFVAAGPDTAIMESFVVSSDTNLDIDFGPVAQNPAIKGIEILQIADNDTLGSSSSGLDFLSVVVGDSDTQQITLTHLGDVGDADITILSTTITGSAAFTDDFNDVAGVILAPGESTVVTVAFAPTAPGAAAATLQIDHSGINPPISVSLDGLGTSEQVGTSIVRINAGGPAVGDPEWSEDTAANPSPLSNFATALSNPFTNGSPIDVSDPSIPVGTPASIFSTERSDTPNGEQMQWNIPVVAGTYEVRLYFAEIYGGTASVGARVFDVLIEDQLVLDDYDVFADVGAFAGVMKSFIVNSDDNLDIDFNQIIQNPAIKGIEILQISDGETLGSTTSALDFLSVDVGDSDTQQITLTHLGEVGDADITIQSTAITGSAAFTDDFNDVAGVVLAPGESTVVTVAFAPLAAGAAAASLQINHSGINPPITVSLAGTGVAQQAGSSIVRINAGGPVVGDPEWSEDTDANPSPLSNSVAAQSGTFTTATPIDVSHPSIPVGTPASIFSTERSDVVNGEEMQWDIPVIAGPYEVRLYFAEIFGGAAEPLARVFNVLIEDEVVLDHYDVFADVGAFTGVMKSFVITSDDNLDIDFSAIIQNPAIKGIEVVSLQEENTLFLSDDSIDFGSVWTQGPEIETVRVTNAGLPGDPSITISSTSITGSAEFTDNFDDVNGVVLAPGESLNIGVTFTPVDLTADQATLEIQHSGSNSPLIVTLTGVGSETSPIAFGKSTLADTSTLQHPTSLDWGPDDRLYAAYQNGTIVVYSVERNASNDYTATIEEEITLVRDIPNHDDDGTPNPGLTTRLMTGILVTGTAENPVIYTSSSDPRIGAGPSGEDLNLDTNSIVVSQLSWDGSQWSKVDLVRGLPRSEESHTTNGLLLDEDTNTILITGSGNTNAGAPSNNFAFQTEYAYSAAILSIDLDALNALPELVDINGQVYKYNLPTLDDEDRDFDGSGSDEDLANGIQDVFGGNNGKNQAILDPNSPVQIYAPGFRNAYDIVRTENGNLYTIDNGANAGWGDIPILDPETGLATNQVSEPGGTIFDNLQLITGPGYYGGHPNPTRASTANTFNPSNPQSPVALVGGNPLESIFSVPQANTGALAVFGASTNGLAEYTASNFGGEMQGDLLAASFFGYNSISRLSPDETGAALDLNEILFSNVDLAPLEVIAVGDDGLFPGSIWVTDWATGAIIVFEPNDYEGGSGGPIDPNDLDGDGYSNDDEIANETNPNSAGDVPPDNDGDFLSDLLDDNDDNDALIDVDDPFAVDPDNGITTPVGISYTWASDTPNSGGLLNLGFTGVMTNGVDNYKDLYDTSNLTAGGAAGVLTLDMASEGDALGATNTQEQAFQFGVNVSGEIDPFTVRSRILAPFAGATPEGDQSMGIFLGTGDQDNYIKIVVTANGGGGVTTLSEVGGIATPGALDTFTLGGVNFVDLYLTVDPVALTVQPSYTVTQAGETSSRINLGSPLSIPASWLNGTTAMAVGVISTSAGPAPTFPATWDFISVLTEEKNLEVSPESLSALSVELGQSTSRQIVITHAGAPTSAAIVLNETTITGTNAAAFSDSFNDAGTITLQPGESTILTVAFSPTEAGAANALLSITDPGGGTLLEIQLAGVANNAATTSSAAFTIDTGGSINGSVFTIGSFEVENLSTGGQGISEIRLDLSTGILPDMVFDPFGTAGDTDAKNFQADSSGATVGLGTHQFEVPHDNGFDILVVPFTDFDSGETFSFSIDVDPTSIQGSAGPGPNESGSVSGLELIGSTVTIVFDDGSTQTAQLYLTPATVGSSENILRSETSSQLFVELVGVPYSPTAVLSEESQTVRVTGPVGADISLMVLESGLFTEGLVDGGFDIDPFESNSALGVTEFAATIGAGGFVDIPVTLLNTNVDGGLNTLVAVVREDDGHTGPLSPPLVVQLDAGANTAPTIVSPIGSIVASENDPNTIIDLTTVFDDAQDGTGLTYTVQSNSDPTLVAASIVGGTLTLDYLLDQVGSTSIVVRATDTGGLFVEDTISITVSPVVTSSLAIESGFVASVSSNAWTTVNLANSYASMVVVATPNYDGQSAPLVTRIQNATGNSFDVMIQRADNSTAVTTADVFFFVVEEGVYTVAEHGVQFEAVKYNSTVTDSVSGWNGELQTYGNSYTSPAVLGQVMTYNDTGFSTFWSKAEAVGDAPSSTVLYTGKHVGEDPSARAAETIGYVVFEAGSYDVGGWAFTVGLGANTVEGVTQTDAAVYDITGPENPTAAVLSQSGMNGGHGSWALLNGANPFSSTTLSLSVDEDQVADNERFHIAEQVAYIVFGAGTTQGGGGDPDPLPPTPSAPGVYDPQTAQFQLRSELTAGPADVATFTLGSPGWTPLVGDWDGDGDETIGLYNPATATFFLSNEFGQPADIPSFSYGAAGWVPIAGDWDGDGTDTIGVFDPATAIFFLRNSNDGGVADEAFGFGAPGWVPVTGDWDGDGTDTIGVFDSTTANWFLRNSNSSGGIDYPVFSYGGGGWVPVTGDWDNNATDTIGVWNPQTAEFFLRNSISGGIPDIAPFVFGSAGQIPVIGNWSPAPAPLSLSAPQASSSGVPATFGLEEESTGAESLTSSALPAELFFSAIDLQDDSIVAEEKSSLKATSAESIDPLVYDSEGDDLAESIAKSLQLDGSPEDATDEAFKSLFS